MISQSMVIVTEACVHADFHSLSNVCRLLIALTAATAAKGPYSQGGSGLTAAHCAAISRCLLAASPLGKVSTP